MRWTCPKGHEDLLADSLDTTRDLVASLALTHYCRACATPYLLPPEAQRRVLQCLETRALRTWLANEEMSVGARAWSFSVVRLSLLAQMPSDLVEIEVMADAGDEAPRVRLTIRVAIEDLAMPERMRRVLRLRLERQVG